MGDIAVVCHGAGETEAQRQGGLAGLGVSGETCSLQAQGGATEHPGQVQEVVLFAPEIGRAHV